jgi:hypothetical protein
MSALISALGYDPDTTTLGIQFHDGATYHYCGVTPAVYAGLIGAPSLGKHFHRYIRPHYPGVRQGQKADWIKGVPRG